MFKTLLEAAAFALIASSSLQAQQPLSKQVKADIVFQEITNAIATNKPNDALEGILRYRQLGLPVPPRLLFVEGRLAMIKGDYLRAEVAFNEYLRVAGKSDRNYAEAIRLYPDISRQAEARRAADTLKLQQEFNSLGEEERIRIFKLIQECRSADQYIETNRSWSEKYPGSNDRFSIYFRDRATAAERTLESECPQLGKWRNSKVELKSQ